MQLKMRADDPSRNMLVVLEKSSLHIPIGHCVLNDVSLQKITPRMIQLYHLLLGTIFLDSIFLYALVIFQDFGAVVIVTLPKIL